MPDELRQSKALYRISMQPSVRRCCFSRATLLLSVATVVFGSFRAKGGNPPQVIQILANCVLGTVTVSYSEPVQLGGTYVFVPATEVQGFAYAAPHPR